MKRFITILILLISISFNITIKASNSTLPSYYNLRDEYIIKTPDQTMFNNCWGFATLKSLETTLMKATNKYYDFSECYLTLIQKKVSSYVTIGATGWDMSSAYNYMKQYGVLKEYDCSFENLFYCNNTNFDETFNYYYNMSDKDIMKNISLKTYYFNQKEEIKNHILNSGSVNLNMVNVGYKKHQNNNTYYAVTSQTTGGHAVSIIGWDDNYSVTIDNKTYKGAFIVLNSYGSSSQTDGVFYYLYDFLYTGTKLYGFTYNAISEVTNITKSNYDINIAGMFDSNNNFNTYTNRCKQNNIYTKDIKEVNYKYNGDIKSFKTDIIKNHNITNDFIVSYNNNIITLKANNTLSGKYKVIFYINGKKFEEDIIIMNNLEIESACFNKFSSNQSAQYTSFDNSNNNDFYLTNISGKSGALLLTVSPYFKMTSYEVSSSDISLINSLDINRLYILINNTTNGIYNYNVTLRSDIDEVTYNIIYCYGDYKLVNVLHNNTNHSLNYSKIEVLSNDKNILLNNDIGSNYLYKSSDINGKVVNSISLDDITPSSGNNAYLNKYPQYTDYYYQVIVNDIYSDLRIIQSFEKEVVKASLRLYNIENTISDLDLRIGGSISFDSYDDNIIYGIIILNSQSDIITIKDYINTLSIQNTSSNLTEITKLINSGYAMKTNGVLSNDGFTHSWVISNSSSENYDKEIICSHFMIYNNDVYFSESSKYTIREVLKTYIDMIDNNTLNVYDWIKEELKRYYSL